MPTLKEILFAVYRLTHHFVLYPICFWIGHFEKNNFASKYNNFAKKYSVFFCFSYLKTQHENSGSINSKQIYF